MTVRWSPYAKERWALITSLDDFDRKILYADFFEQETTWAHIKAAETLTRNYGIPLRYYVDSLRVFHFVQGRDSFWRKHAPQTVRFTPLPGRFQVFALRKQGKEGIVYLDLLPYLSHMPPPRMSSAYQRHEWSMDTGGYLPSTMK